MDVIVDQVAGLDVWKASVTVCVRTVRDAQWIARLVEHGLVAPRSCHRRGSVDCAA